MKVKFMLMRIMGQICDACGNPLGTGFGCLKAL